MHKIDQIEAIVGDLSDINKFEKLLQLLRITNTAINQTESQLCWVEPGEIKGEHKIVFIPRTDALKQIKTRCRKEGAEIPHDDELIDTFKAIHWACEL